MIIINYIYISSIHITFWVNNIMGEIGAPGSIGK